MKAIRKPGPAPGLVLCDAPVPEIRSRDVLVKVRRAGICGTDLHIHQWDRWSRHRVNPPVILGHEFMGEVVETGRLVRNIERRNPRPNAAGRPGPATGGSGRRGEWRQLRARTI